MMYTVKRIDEDLNFGCEERPRKPQAQLSLLRCPS